jgi:ammonium transporter, Amt family
MPKVETRFCRKLSERLKNLSTRINLVMIQKKHLLATGGLLLGGAAAAQAQSTTTPFTPDSGDTAWMLVATALVMLMTPGLAFFYAGMVRRKNTINVLMQSFVALSVITVLWLLVGYSLSFAPGNPVIGGLSYLFQANTDASKQLTLNGAPLTIPHPLFMVFQMMFAIITPALISGAIVDRMKFSAYLFFIAAWSLLVYSPMAHMMWGEGGLFFKMGAVDYAGGTVVHTLAGVSALILSTLVGRRKFIRGEETRPHNVPFILLGTGLLWFGWFGFNAGSAGGAGNIATNALVVTHVSAAVAAATWMLIDVIRGGKPTAFGFAAGAVIGLVSITPASGYVSPLSAIIVGAVASIVGYMGILLKEKIRYDDSLDVVAVHGMGGIWGMLSVGLFASKAINPAISNGLLLGGGPNLLLNQFMATAAAVILAGVGTLGVGMLAKVLFKGLRVEPQEEGVGLDETVHGETAYTGEDLVLQEAEPAGFSKAA